MEKQNKILVIDDEETMLDCCSQVLCPLGLVVETAKNGRLGLDKLKEIKPDVVLVDLRMHGISGMEILEKINEIDEQIVTIVITGYGTLESAIEAMKKGAYDFITKPFTPDVLRITMKRALDKRKLSLEAISFQQEKERLRQNFISIVSHEIKSPIVTVQQNLEIILNEMFGKITDKQREILLRMNLKLTELKKLVNDWQKIAAINSQEIVENMEILKLDEIIYDVETALEEQIRNKKIKMKINIPDSISRVFYGDKSRLKEVFLNLLDNAVKYNHENGEVEISARENGNYIAISIIDTGIGIDAKYLPFVFDEFFRVRDEAKLDLGAGLGLFIVKKIIDAHSGKVEARSELGAGSTFTVFLPKVKNDKFNSGRI